MMQLEAMRIEAGRRMGFPDPAALVIPKPVLIAPAMGASALTTRYFMPHDCHRALAVTGAIAIATACALPGTIAAALAGTITLPAQISLEHPSGRIDVHLAASAGRSELAASVQRTARRLFEGAVFARRTDLARPTPPAR
jgi:2-methylaconitate cis-trans-isomerase PrpF